MTSSPRFQPARAAGRQRYRPADHSSVVFDGGFWQSWTETVRNVTIPTQHKRLEEEGFLEVLDFDKPAGAAGAPIQPSGLSMQHFFDSDFGKWIEAASYTLKAHPNPGARSEDRRDRRAARQRRRWPMATSTAGSSAASRTSAGPTCATCTRCTATGHLIEGAVAYYEATGKRRFLDVMMPRTSTISSTRSGAEPGKLRGYCGHEEIELALVKLYRADRRAAPSGAATLLRRRARPAAVTTTTRRRASAARTRATTGLQDLCLQPGAHAGARAAPGRRPCGARHVPVTPRWRISPARTATRTCRRPATGCCDNLSPPALYVTGGLGPSASNEGFTREYDLPNETAYAETCAAVALGFWGHRMAQIDLDSRFTDMLERCSTTARCPASRATASIISTRTCWRATAAPPLEMALLPVLPDQHRPADRLARQLFLFHERR